MKLLLVGTVVPEEIEYREELVSSAGNRFQMNLARNLLRLGHEVTTLTYVGMPLHSESIELLRKNPEVVDGATSIYVFKESNPIKTCITFSKKVKELLQTGVQQVLAYNVVHTWANLPKLAQRAGARSVLFLADFTPPSAHTSKARSIYASLMLTSIRRFSKVVALSPYVKENLGLEKEVFLMMGGVDQQLLDYFDTDRKADIDSDIDCNTDKNFDKQQDEHSNNNLDKCSNGIADKSLRFMYSGLLSQVTGVDQLLQAFSLLESDHTELILTGKGPLLDEVIAATKKDSRIQYLGSLSYEDYLATIGEADLLINPRNMALPENQNNFPSKIMDYLVSGKPILSTAFAGNEYFADCMTICDSSKDGLLEGLERFDAQLLEISEEEKMRRRQHNFSIAKSYEWKTLLEKVLL